MNSREMASVALKLIGFYAFSVSLASSLQFLLALERSSKWTAVGDTTANANLIASAVVCLAYESFFLLLIFKSKKIASILFQEENQLQIGISSESLQAVAYSSVGLFLVADSLDTIFRVLGNLWVSTDLMVEEQRAAFLVAEWATRVGLMVRLATGLYLFLRPNSATKLWRLFQELRPMDRKID